jgi:hypothetical protein
VLLFVEIMAVTMMVVAMMLDVGLAGLGSMVMRVMAVAGRGVGMMRGDFTVIFFVMLGGLAMVMRGLFVMIGGIMVMLAGRVLVLGHGILPWKQRLCGAAPTSGAAFATLACLQLAVAQISSGTILRNAAKQVPNNLHQSVL